ncbi:putative bifunctional diguanylate cyclase/phosphodiesterase [Altererythrobacter sp. GH1-8]|uniref:putative bifunctional diguanylate cyclase/phosphodiesterase n=1 Tax=Altererythrobacter sp. GH1-8 TaxID=3349333 RepID=UPI00374D155B
MSGIIGKITGASWRQEAKQAPLCPIKETDLARRVELLDSFEQAGLGWFWATDAFGRIIYLSENAIAKLGWNKDDLIGRALTDLFLPEQDEDGVSQSERPLKFLLSARNSITQLDVRLAVEGAEIWWEIAGKPQFDKKGEFNGYRGSAKDITATRENQRNSERLSQYDSLTGLANRHRMSKRLGSTLAAYRNAKRSCALMMLDLDRFKQVNDTLGHPAGDELLKQVAGRLGQIIGKRGEIGRLGGDEFQVMLPDIDDRGILGDLASRVIQMVSQPYSINGARAIIGTSVGIAVAPYDGVNTEELVKAADLALYSAKASGRGQFRFYSSALKDGAKHRRNMEEDLRDALHRDELSMAYQPIVDARTHKVACFEALMRWEHPERGPVSPAEFIPIAEDCGLIKKIGNWALETACCEAQSWPVELRVAINVSAVQFANDDFSLTVKRALKKSGIAPHRVELEITESIFMGDDERTQRMFKELKALGVRLALDDFGTGYSSLSYLRKAPFDKIKIDQSFVRGSCEPGNNNAAIISSIVSLADALGMETVAEGVETKDELALVTKRQATHMQGAIFSFAIKHEQVMEKLASGDLLYEPRGPERYRAGRRREFRRIGLIHGNYRYNVVLRNLSKSGAMIEGLMDVPLDTEVVLDLGDGQLAVAVVKRTEGYSQGLEFETPLISDGYEGLCTRHRVSPYQIEAAGKPLAALPADAYAALLDKGAKPDSLPQFREIPVAGFQAKVA